MEEEATEKCGGVLDVSWKVIHSLTISQIHSLGKIYGIEVVTPGKDESFWIQRSKGVELTKRALETLTPENMMSQVLGDPRNQVLEIICPMKIRRDKMKGHVYSRAEKKKTRLVITKRALLKDGSTLPFGYLSSV